MAPTQLLGLAQQPPSLILSLLLKINPPIHPLGRMRILNLVVFGLEWIENNQLDLIEKYHLLLTP